MTTKIIYAAEFVEFDINKDLETFEQVKKELNNLSVDELLKINKQFNLLENSKKLEKIKKIVRFVLEWEVFFKELNFIIDDFEIDYKAKGFYIPDENRIKIIKEIFDQLKIVSTIYFLRFSDQLINLIYQSLGNYDSNQLINNMIYGEMHKTFIQFMKDKIKELPLSTTPKKRFSFLSRFKHLKAF